MFQPDSNIFLMKTSYIDTALILDCASGNWKPSSIHELRAMQAAGGVKGAASSGRMSMITEE